MGERGNKFKKAVQRVMRDVGNDLLLHRAIDNGNVDELKRLLKGGAQTCVFDQHGMAPIHKAATQGQAEAILLLVAHGASINIPNHKTGMTALHYARRENSDIIRLLLSCGMDQFIANKFGKRPDTGLLADELQKFDHLKYLIQYRSITTMFDFVSKKDKITLEKNRGLHIQRQNNSSVGQTFFYCRQIPKEYLCICNGGTSTLKDHIQNEKMAVISDVYEYFVKDKVCNVEINVAVFKDGTRFDDIMLIDNYGKHIPATTVQLSSTEINAIVKMDLSACEASLQSFVIVIQSRTEMFSATGAEQTVTSSIETNFSINIPDDCLPEQTQVTMKVVPTDGDVTSIQETDAINKASNFHEVRTNQKNKKALTVSIPLPEGFSDRGSNRDLVVFEIQTPSAMRWKPIEATFQLDTGIATIESSGNGTCIVTELSRQSSPGILTKVGTFFYHLYESVCRRQSYCTFFAVPKHVTDHNFRIAVGVADEELKQKYIEDLVNNDGFIYEFSQITSNLLCAHKSTYEVSMDPDMVQVRGLQNLELVYAHGKPTHQHFLVSTKEETQFVTCQIDRLNSQPERSCLTQLHVQLTKLPSRRQGLSAYVNNTDTEFPTEGLITELTRDIGFECMMIGVCLGMQYVFLEDLEGRGNLWDINHKVFSNWKKSSCQKSDRGVIKLIQTLRMLERNDIVAVVDESIQHFTSLNPDHALSEWVKDTASSERDVNAECTCRYQNPFISHFVQQKHYIKPWGDSWKKYLVKLACMMGYNEYLLTRIGCKPEDFSAIRRLIRLPSAAMFKCLMLAKRKYGDAIHFYQDLLAALTDIGNNVMVDTIVTDIKHGFQDQNSSSAMRTLLAKYDRTDEKLQETSKYE